MVPGISPSVYRRLRLSASYSKELYSTEESELRDMGLHGGYLYFACENECGEDWQLVRIPLSGSGSPEVIAPLYQNPSVSHEEDLIYMNARQRVDVLRLSTNQVSFVAFDLGKVFPTPNFLYVASNEGLDRYRKLDGGQVGPKSSLPIAGDASIFHDGEWLYFFDGKVRRIRDE